MDVGILSSGLLAMERAGDGAFASLMPSVQELFRLVMLTTWGVCICIMVLTGRFLNPAMVKALALFVGIGWLIKVFPVASDKIITALGNIGGIVVPDLQFDLSDPGYIAYFGFKAVKPLMNTARTFIDPISIFFYFFDLMFYLFAIVTVLLAFLALAIHAFFARVEYLILRTAAWFTFPFAALSKTSFVASKAIGYIAAVGLRVMALSLLAAISTVTLAQYEQYKVTDITAAFGLAVLSIALLIANVKAPAAAAALINSGPIMDGTTAWRALRAGASAGFQSLSSTVSNGVAAGRAAGGSASAMVLGIAKAAWNGGTANYGKSGGAGLGGGQSNSSGSGSGAAGSRNQRSYGPGSYRGGWSMGQRP